MANYILRDIPDDVHKRCRKITIDTGVTLKEILLEGLTRVLDDPKSIANRKNPVVPWTPPRKKP